MMLLLLFVLLVVFLGLTIHHRRRLRHSANRNRVRPLQQRQWLFGFDVAFQFAQWVTQRVVLQESSRWMERNGKTFSVQFAGHSNVCTADAINAEAILKANAGDFELSHVRRQAFRPVVGDGMIASNGPSWSLGRKVLRKALAQKRIRDLHQYEEHAQNLFTHLPDDGATVDLQKLLPLFTMDCSTQFILGSSTFWLKHHTSDEVLRIGLALDYVLDIMRFRTDLGVFVHLHWNRKFQKCCKLVHAFVDSYIARSTGNSAHLRIQRPDASKQISYVEALLISGMSLSKTRDNVLTTLLAGRDTTAALIGFVLWNLARNQRVQEQLRTAVAALRGLAFSFKELSEVYYLWWIIKEVLRLYPSIPANDRETKHDTYIPRGGEDDKREAFIPAGTIIDIHTWGMHRDRSLWGEDADDFRPERWEDLSDPVGFLPFGSGPRSCPGQELAMIQSAYFVVRFLQTFERLESRDDGPFVEHVTISLASFNGFKVALWRSSNALIA